LAVTDSATTSVAMLLGNGDGTFQAPVSYAAGGQPWAVAALDIQGDGNLDLALTNNFEGDVGILLGNWDGTFHLVITNATAVPLGLAIADLNNEGASDLLIAGPNNQVTTFLNTGGTLVSTSSSANPSHLGQPVTFTATVAPTFSFIGTP